MTSFEDRKKGYEAKYLKDQEAQFKITAKRNKFLGLWAAEIVKPENIDEYVKEVRLSDLEKPGDDDIIDKLLGDFEKKSVNISREDIVQNINECQQQAIDEFMKESEVA